MEGRSLPSSGDGATSVCAQGGDTAGGSRGASHGAVLHTPVGCYLHLHLGGLQSHSGVCGEGAGIVFTLGVSGGAAGVPEVAPAQLLHHHREKKPRVEAAS